MSTIRRQILNEKKDIRIFLPLKEKSGHFTAMIKTMNYVAPRVFKFAMNEY